jgi:hypothetical protein
VTGDFREEGAQAGWWLHGDSAADLERLARHVWRCGELSETLEAGTDAGKEVLSRLR